ncbi:oxysterol-binding protein [Histoplasma capsulatum G186AR]|uniref:Oxysterol-binding protein n=1 Tax=Ajellomyces capsulatus TaxID=5037 RepID=A0A8H8CU32_AJECA|nr:oxysterol-binding protein [Histoplasma capsulatum]QSS71390.1 oxysterol-binding protein [Histoplasma capsulatum G186AR]
MLPKIPLVHQQSHSRSSKNNSFSSLDESSGGSSPNAEDETAVEPEQGNVLTHIISQLRPGADLGRVTLPTFILEPRSMLERITNFMAHPETLLPMPEIDDPVQRFVSVVRFYLSGWHIKPPGVKKPLNPILGETFTCYWDYEDGTRSYYISEQTSHHPPKSSYFFMAPEHHIRIDGTLKPRSKFLGNSAASMMEGIAILSFLNRGEPGKGERYIVTQPNMYARGILWGKMKYELGDHSVIRCPENNLSADIEFKTKGYFSGTYNAIGGMIKDDRTGEILYELSGLWNGEMFIKRVASGQKELLFNATNAKHTPPLVRPLEEQEPHESQRLWNSTVQALIARNHDLATEEKTKIEEMQRLEASKRLEDGVEWRPKLFRTVRGGPQGPGEGEEDLEWILNAKINPYNPTVAEQQILSVAAILPGQKPHCQFEIPAHSSSRSHKSEKASSSGQLAKMTAETHPTQQNNISNLIDFDEGSNNGQSDENKILKSAGPSVGSMDILGGDGQDDTHAQASPSSNYHPPNMANIMTPLQPTSSPAQTRSLHSRNSAASDNDDFVDAQS